MDEIKIHSWTTTTTKRGNEKQNFCLTLTVGMAVATVATIAAFAPAITPSKQHQK